MSNDAPRADAVGYVVAYDPFGEPSAFFGAVEYGCMHTPRGPSRK
jgi:hypothetical protein